MTPDGVFNYNNILVVSTTGLGDTLLSTPTLAALRELFPGASIKGMVRDRHVSLLANNPDINGLIPLKKGWIGFYKALKQFKKFHFDIAVFLHVSDPRPVTLCVLAGIPRIVGVSPQPNFYRFFSQSIEIQSKRHAIDQRMAILQRMFPNKTKWPQRMTLPLNTDATTQVQNHLHQLISGHHCTDLLIGFQPGASRLYKMWPAERFIDLGRRLLNKNPKLVLIIFGSSHETPLCRAIKNGIGIKNRVISLAGTLKLKELPHYIKNLRCLVTNDTGPMHVAVAVKTPTVSLFVPTHASITGPRQDPQKHIAISKKPPCGNNCTEKRCTTNIECMRLIPVHEVFIAVQDLLDRCGQ